MICARGLIEEVLALAKGEAGRIEIASGASSGLPTSPRVFNAAFSTSLASKGLALQIDVAACPTVESDHAKVRQVLYNFLANAIKYAPESGTLHLQAHLVDSNSVEISVIDHGPGVPEDLRQVIFEKFRQGDSGLARGHGGTGFVSLACCPSVHRRILRGSVLVVMPPLAVGPPSCCGCPWSGRVNPGGLCCPTRTTRPVHADAWPSPRLHPAALDQAAQSQPFASYVAYRWLHAGGHRRWP